MTFEYCRIPKPTRQYMEELKAEVVRLVRDSARPVPEVARDLGIADQLLYRWRVEQRQAEELGHSRQSLQAEQAELAQLRPEAAVLKQERDFLKCAAAFFAKESREPYGSPRIWDTLFYLSLNNFYSQRRSISTIPR